MTKWFGVSDVSWQVRTDKSERPEVGASTLTLRAGKTVQAHGLLHALAGLSGPVGFALIEARVSVDASAMRYVCFRFNGGPAGCHYQVLLKDDQAEHVRGTLTFQSDFVAKGGSQNVCLPFSGFVATIRGTKVSGFELNQRALQSFSIQISRSRLNEPLRSQNPLEFEFGLEADVTLVSSARPEL